MLLLKIERFLEPAGCKGGRVGGGDAFDQIITQSPAMRAALEVASKVARTGASVVISGESGTGKELVAKAIHGESARRAKPFVAVNCAAIPPSLIESELFGVGKGAFTGADQGRAGYIEMSESGTLFLDEVGELPMELQGKLLRVLETKEVTRIGGTAPRKLDFRILSATNRDLSELVQKGEFRDDIFFRLNVVPVILPPLRERKEDIPLLLAHFVDGFCSRRAIQPPVFSPQVLEQLCQYRYPGNVREIRNLVERIVLFHPGERILPQHLLQEMREPAGIGHQFASFVMGKPLKEALAEYEKRYIEKVVHHAGGRKSVAAQMLGFSRKVLWEKLKR
jgi:transcriptional regulator with PAS, ATPase and Fis domain